MKKIASHAGIFIILLCTILALPVHAAKLLVPGGQVIGIHLADDTLYVAAIDETFGSAAKSAGLQVGDRIVAVNGQSVCSAAQVRAILENAPDKAEISILRNNQAKKICFQPVSTQQGPRLGVYLKQGTTGIGTVTYYDPTQNSFGALGHGVNAPSGALLKLTSGNIYPATVLSVKKGKIGTPGQLMGTVTSPSSSGQLRKNTAQGVFGTTTCVAAEPLPSASRTEVTTGNATIRCTVSGNSLREYSVEILKIYPTPGSQGRNLLLKVTDPDLLAVTGGIVQGMSGSPILQNGKLIGAVTHVLVNDPTRGYGIFIENMLSAAG